MTTISDVRSPGSANPWDDPAESRRLLELAGELVDRDCCIQWLKGGGLVVTVVGTEGDLPLLELLWRRYGGTVLHEELATWIIRNHEAKTFCAAVAAYSCADGRHRAMCTIGRVDCPPAPPRRDRRSSLTRQAPKAKRRRSPLYQPKIEQPCGLSPEERHEVSRILAEHVRLGQYGRFMDAIGAADCKQPFQRLQELLGGHIEEVAADGSWAYRFRGEPLEVRLEALLDDLAPEQTALVGSLLRKLRKQREQDERRSVSWIRDQATRGAPRHATESPATGGSRDHDGITRG